MKGRIIYPDGPPKWKFWKMKMTIIKVKHVFFGQFIHLRGTCLGSMLNFSSMALCVECPPDLSHWFDVPNVKNCEFCFLQRALFCLFFEHYMTLRLGKLYTVFTKLQLLFAIHPEIPASFSATFWRVALLSRLQGSFRLVSALRIWSSQSIRPHASLVAPAVLSSFAEGDVSWKDLHREVLVDAPDDSYLTGLSGR